MLILDDMSNTGNDSKFPHSANILCIVVTFSVLNAATLVNDVHCPVPVTVEVPDHLVDDFRDVVYIASDPCSYMESYPYDWIDYDD